jgi:hypothetical protein
MTVQLFHIKIYNQISINFGTEDLTIFFRANSIFILISYQPYTNSALCEAQMKLN